MAWPWNPALWHDIDAARRGYAGVANAVAGFEPVNMVARPDSAQLARELCGEGVTIIEWLLLVEVVSAHDPGPVGRRWREWLWEGSESLFSEASAERERRSAGPPRRRARA